MTSTNPNFNWIANYIWGIADDMLRDCYPLIREAINVTAITSEERR